MFKMGGCKLLKDKDVTEAVSGEGHNRAMRHLEPLKSCPFCGGEADYETGGPGVTTENWVAVTCGSCFSCSCFVDWSDLDGPTSAYAKALAHARWNRRVGEEE